MTKLLLSLHVIVAIVAVGPVTVAASVFPRTAREAAAAPGDPAPPAALRALHRICRVYALLALLVPALGLATAGAMGVLGDTWLTVSIFLTGGAGFVLAGLVLPLQERILRQLDAPVASPAPVPAAPATVTLASNAPASVALASTAPAGAAPAAATVTSPALASTVPATAARLAMTVGLFNLLWATVTVLMIVRPGSTTGA